MDDDSQHKFQSNYDCVMVRGAISTYNQVAHRVVPSVLGIDVGAILEEAPADVDPAVERRDMERGTAIVVAGVDEAAIFLEELPHGGGIVLVGVPQDQ